MLIINISRMRANLPVITLQIKKGAGSTYPPQNLTLKTL